MLRSQDRRLMRNIFEVHTHHCFSSFLRLRATSFPFGLMERERERDRQREIDREGDRMGETSERRMLEAFPPIGPPGTHTDQSDYPRQRCTELGDFKPKEGMDGSEEGMLEGNTLWGWRGLGSSCAK